jgi:hypothetical protein
MIRCPVVEMLFGRYKKNGDSNFCAAQPNG